RAAVRAARGWRTRLAPRPHATRRRPRGGRDRAVCAVAVCSWDARSFGARGFVEMGTAGPVGCVHRLLARCLDLAEPHRLRARANVDTLALNAYHAGRQVV